VNQLVTSIGGFQVGQNNSGTVINMARTTGDMFWNVLKENHVIAGPTLAANHEARHELIAKVE
jgi:hypothetical protein